MARPMNSPRRQITDLSESIQIRELNRQLDWLWQQLLGGISMKNISEHGKEEAVDLIESTAADIYDPQIDGINDSITSIEGAISGIESDLSDAQSDITQLGSSLAYTQDDVDDLEDDLSSVSSRVAKLESSLVYPISEP